MDDEILASLLEAMPLPALLIGADARIRAVNAPGAQMFGAGLAGGLIGRHHAMAVRQPSLLAAIEAALLRGASADLRYAHARAHARGPREDVFRATVAPVGLGTGPGAGRAALCSFTDTTEAEQIAQIRRDFVANVSHELRTPLTTLMGFIETLKGPARSDEAARLRFLEIMEREAGRMNRLVRDLLSLSRVEAEERQRPQGSCDMARLIGSVALTLAPMATELGVKIVVAGAEGAAPGAFIVPGDSDQLVQVFQNLIENAVKYGSPGKRVTVTLSLPDEDPILRQPAVVIEVRDEGEGIDPIHLPRLTERFYRVDTHRSRAQGGTGLGLAIVKHIVQRHRGRLKITSEKGVGSRFLVVLPRR